MATIKTQVEKSAVQPYLDSGRVEPCGPAPELTQAALDNTVKIVAQVGPEPYLKVLKEHPDVDIIIGGRSYDPAPFTAFAMFHGLGSSENYGPARHMGKILVSPRVLCLYSGQTRVHVVYRNAEGSVPGRNRVPSLPCSAETTLTSSLSTRAKKSLRSARLRTRCTRRPGQTSWRVPGDG